MKKFKWTIFLIILIGVSCKDKSEITPKIDVELLKLTNGISKTWKLYRSGTCVSLGPDEFAPAGWWDGLSNNGETPCMFEQTFTFHLDGVFVFDDTGVFWGEHDTWRGTILQNKCFEPTAGNMVNKSGVDVSAWGSGTHSFTYDTEMGELTLTGLGAWIGGLVYTNSNGETLIKPVISRTVNLKISQYIGYDLMTVTYNYGSGLYTAIYASYTDQSLEPTIVI